MDLETVNNLFLLQGRQSIVGKQVQLYINGEVAFSGFLLDASVYPDRPDILWQVVYSMDRPRVFFRSSHVVSIESAKPGELDVYRITLTHADDPDGVYAAYKAAKQRAKAAWDAFYAGEGECPM